MKMNSLGRVSKVISSLFSPVKRDKLAGGRAAFGCVAAAEEPETENLMQKKLKPALTALSSLLAKMSQPNQTIQHFVR
jgi:hypothetical protein